MAKNNLEEHFDLHLIFKGEEMVFKARLFKYVYTHKIHVNVFDQEILLEPDEERNYRIVNSQPFESGRPPNIDLLKAIINAIESIVK